MPSLALFLRYEIPRRQALTHRALAFALSAFLGLAHGATAREAYVIRVFAPGPLVEPPCGYLYWIDELAFHNAGSTEATVRLLAISNGTRRPDASDLIVPAGRTRTVRGVGQRWHPEGAAQLWVNHLDIPTSVLMTSRLIPGISQGDPCPIGINTRDYGAAPLPVFLTLRPPDEKQYHLGSDLGAGSTGHAAGARVNVGVFNGGTIAATARIDVRRSCDDEVTESRVVSIPSNAIVQIPGLPHNVGPGCRTVPFVAELSSSYVVVTVDQPSFSYVISLSNELPPKIPIGVPLTR